MPATASSTERTLARLGQLDARRKRLLGWLGTEPASRLQRRPSPDAWSVLEIVEHLVLAERAACRGMPPIEDLPTHRPRLRDRILLPLVRAVLRGPIRVRVPTPAMNPTGQAGLDELRVEWDRNFEWLAIYAASGTSGTVRHPIAGPMTAAQAVHLATLHFERHRRQIDRTLDLLRTQEGAG